MSANTRRSICRVCHGGCGVIVYSDGRRVLKVRGDVQSPVSRGWMCIKGLKSPDIANHPDRLKTPLKRKGQRGQGHWYAISWQEALDEIAQRIEDLRERHGAESIVIGQGTGRHHYMHTVRFANALGTPNWYEPGLAQCFIPRITVSHLTYGGFPVADYYGQTAPACIMFWGHNPLVSSADAELAPAVRRALNSGCMSIAIDPRRSETARRCKKWLPIRPGTDAALALAMLNVIISRELYDAEFVRDHTVGFDKLKDHTARFTPQWASAITRVSAQDIEEAACLYSRLKPAVLEWGLGLEQNSNSLQTVRAVALLRAITGNLDVPGADILGMNVLRSYPLLKDKLPPEQAKKRIGAGEFKLLGGWRAYMPSAHIPGIFNAMNDGGPYRLRGLIVFGSNPLLTVANPKRVFEGLRKLDLLVVTDLFMTPTAQQADYVLPAAFWTEIDHLMGVPLVAENFVFAQSAIVSTPDCRQDEWIIDELSRRLHLPGSELTFRDIFDYQLAPLGIDFAKAVEMTYLCPPHRYCKYVDKGFRTPSRKVELYSASLKRMGYEPLPMYEEPPEGPQTSPELIDDYPLVLITGGRTVEFFHSEHRQVEALRRLRPRPQAQIHTSLAEARGIRHGEEVIISTKRGQIVVTAEVTEDIAPYVVSVEHGWWFPERLSELPHDPDSLWLANANVLTDDGPPYDPAFGSYRLRALLCNVERREGFALPQTLPQGDSSP
ncbi:MAG: molybdopterin-dependent oxidoreductase [Nitrospirae bacterium]|nr:molybdopterin-dependent oxidoreductase [Nitrospirota bacterium]